MTKKDLFRSLIYLSCAMALLSCTANQSGRSSPATTHAVQKWVQVGDYDIFIHEIIDNKEVTDGKRLVYVEVEYANSRSTEALGCRRNQWYLYDEQGYSYEAEAGNNYYENKDLQYLGGERFVNPGMKLRGWLVFQIPENTKLERLQFITGFVGTETADVLLEKAE